MVLDQATPGAALWRKPWFALLVAIALVYAALAWHNRDVNRISRRMESLRAAVSKAPQEPPLAAMVKAKEISVFFTEFAPVNAGWPILPLNGREEIAIAAHQLRSNMTEIKVLIRDKAIHLDKDRRHATAEVVIEGFFTCGGETEKEMRDFRLAWVKEDGKWLIASVEPLQTIRRPTPRDPRAR